MPKISIPGNRKNALKQARAHGYLARSCKTKRTRHGLITTCQLSGYEDAPATKLLATHCAVCARPLVDASSVESGIGPICAARYGGRIACDPAVRAEANKLIYEIARYQKGPEVDAAVKRLHDLGFDVLAKRISKRLSKRVFSNPRIIDTGKYYVFTFPFSPSLVAAIKREVPGKAWAKEMGGWIIPYRSKRDFFEYLKRNFSGRVIDGPKGPFTA